MKIISLRATTSFFLMVLFALLSACGGGGSGSSSTTPVTPVTPTPTASAINLSASLTTVASDNSTNSTITATVVDASNAAVAGVTIAFSADTGFLSTSSAVSDASGKATVTFSSGSANPTTRTATVTATASGKTSQIPIRIAGSTITTASTITNLVVGGPTATLTVTVNSLSGAPIGGTPVTITSSGSGAVTLSTASGTTNASGQLTLTVAGSATGSVTLSVAAVGETRTVGYVVAASAAAFGIISPVADANNAVAGTIGVPVSIVVRAPAPTSQVVFVTTLGSWNGGTSNSVVAPVVSGSQASATLTVPLSTNGVPTAGVANIQVYDAANPALTATLVATFTSTNAAKITLQATPAIVATRSGGNTGLSTLVATVTDPAGNPVGNAAVAFQIITPTGGGETITPAVSQTAAVAATGVTLGQARATLAAGSLPSGARGVQIRASVIGTAVVTEQVYPTPIDVTASGPDATIVIGGTAGSVTFGQATSVADASNGTAYALPMSVLVADSNGNPVANTTVSLSAWPIAFNVGNNVVVPPATTSTCVLGADYYNEDRNENLILDPGEDGTRRLYPSGTLVAGGTIDGLNTPPNSAAGTLPATVQTDSTGVATFTLTYTKSNALWITTRIRASTLVQGTETIGQVIFRLPASIPDVGPPCLLPSNPYRF